VIIEGFVEVNEHVRVDAKAIFPTHVIVPDGAIISVGYVIRIW
jgi:hypothetical protein